MFVIQRSSWEKQWRKGSTQPILLPCELHVKEVGMFPMDALGQKFIIASVYYVYMYYEYTTM